MSRNTPPNETAAFFGGALHDIPKNGCGGDYFGAACVFSKVSSAVLRVLLCCSNLSKCC